MPGNKFADYKLEASLAEPRAVMDPFPRRGQRAVFDRGEARIETAEGEVVERRADPRAAFSGLSGLRRNLRWDALDSAYFGGYAMWNYLTTPLLLTRPGVQTSEGDDWQQGVETWRRLEVTFPEDLDTHSRQQTFYFDSRGRLRRHDYVAEVVGRWARAAHLCAEHVDADGMIFPTRRWVRPVGPVNRVMPGPTLVSLRLSEIEVQ